MRFPVFLLLTIGFSFALGMISVLSRAGFLASLGIGVATLVILQLAYFLFLVMAARRVSQAKSGKNEDQD